MGQYDDLSKSRSKAFGNNYESYSQSRADDNITNEQFIESLDDMLIDEYPDCGYDK